MSPNLFALDGERLLDVLFAVVVLSFFVERALAIVFENRWFVAKLGGKGIKEPITLLVAFAICRRWDFDALSIVLAKQATQTWGHLVTAGIIAGGSKASIKLFHDVLDVRSNAEKERQAMVEAKAKVTEEAARVAALRTALSQAAAPLGGGE
jgi:hypothetical protein